jgi:glycosyltransferase involved in cell wall biosynthesis
MKISLVIITFNEETNIARCIDSAAGLVDEVVVVDSFSTDKTKEICLSRGVLFIENKFEGHIEQKNFAIWQASNDWILSLDADEALSDELKKAIITFAANPVADACEMNRLTNYCGKWIKHTDWYPDRKIRLFNRQKAAWGGVNPHDLVIPQAEIQVLHLRGDILHYSYTSIRQHINQFNFFTEIGAKEAFEKGKRATLPKILFSPVWKFFQSYVIRLGFLDGYYGFVVCAISAFATFTKYLKMKELQKEKSTS